MIELHRTTMSEAEFTEKFNPQTKDGMGELFDIEDVVNLPKRNVWTIVEGDDEMDENWYALPGFHIVNKVGYVTSETPWDDGVYEAIYFDAKDM